MLYPLYNILLLILTVVLAPVACLVLLVHRKYRVGFLEKCGIKIPLLRGASRPLWIHAVSVGEVMAAVPLIREIKQRHPTLPIIVSTITATGNTTAQRNLKGIDQVLFFPFDYNFIVRRYLSRIQPCAFVALETEIWPNFLRELNRQKIPALIVSGRISLRSFPRYYRCRFFFQQVLKHLTWCCMQTREDADRIIRIGADPRRVSVTGNVKFDHQIPPISEQEHERLRTELRICEGQLVFIAGSTHRGEEEIILEVFAAVKKRFPDTVLILAPRHPERFDEVAALLRQSGLRWVKRTMLTTAPSQNTGNDVILLDTIGELSKIYSLGTVIFIGGSLVPVGGHNVLEPGVFKKPVLFGPHMGNFSEIASILTSRHAACQVGDAEDCIRQVIKLLENSELRTQIGDAAFRVIEENTGAVTKSLAMLEAILGLHD